MKEGTSCPCMWIMNPYKYNPVPYQPPSNNINLSPPSSSDQSVQQYTSTTYLRYRNLLTKCKLDRRSNHLDPNSQRIISKLLSRESLGVSNICWDGNWDWHRAGIAEWGDCYCWDHACGGVDIPGQFGLACIAGHAIFERGVDLGFVSWGFL